MLEKNKFGDAGNSILIEERINGIEASVFAVSDGNNAVLIGTAQDHKRAYDNDEGPNTGGMGAISPAPALNQNLNKEIFDQFNKALKQRSDRGHFAEITFIGINSAKVKEHKKTGSILNVTVEFIAEIITCIKDKDKKIISGDPEKIKKIYDTWVFSRDTTSANPNWKLVNILT